MYQARAASSPHPFQNYLSTLSYSLAGDMISDITRPFKHICIHGKQPQLILPLLHSHNQRFNLTEKDYHVTLVDYLRSPSKEELIGVGSVVKEIRYVSGP